MEVSLSKALQNIEKSKNLFPIITPVLPCPGNVPITQWINFLTTRMTQNIFMAGKFGSQKKKQTDQMTNWVENKEKLRAVEENI